MSGQAATLPIGVVASAHEAEVPFRLMAALGRSGAGVNGRPQPRAGRSEARATTRAWRGRAKRTIDPGVSGGHCEGQTHRG
jgi:hypothetical protein